MKGQGHINLTQGRDIMDKVKALNETCEIYRHYGELTALLPLMRQNNMMELKEALVTLGAIVDELACSIDDALGAIEESFFGVDTKYRLS